MRAHPILLLAVGLMWAGCDDTGTPPSGDGTLVLSTSTAGDDPDRTYGVAAFGIAAITPGGWMPYLNFDALVGADDLDRYRVSLGLRREL